MWQSPNQKTAKAGSKKGGRDRHRSSLHVKRVTAEISSSNGRQKSEGKTEPGAESRSEPDALARILLNDLSPRGVGIYCNKAFIAGQEIALVLAVPTRIYLRGKVMYCQEQEQKTAVITAMPFYYRIGIKFIFENAAEEAAVNKYCEDLLRALFANAA